MPPRVTDDHVVAGVATGIGRHTGVDPFLVRWAFVLLALAGGVGVALYLAAWGLMSPAAAATTAGRAPSDERRIGFAMLVGAALLMLRDIGLWAGDLLMVPLLLGALGSAVIWASTNGPAGRLPRLAWHTAADWPRGPAGVARLATGALLVLVGMTLFLATNGLFAAIRVAALATVVTVLGAGLVLGPFLARLVQDLRAERIARIRDQERAELAAHLHDSVLHTLALMQRASSLSETVALARVQERELRAWLHGRTGASDADLRSAVDRLASHVERLHEVPVDAVVVGDEPLDERAAALVAALQEAAVNAARHSGAGRISVYAEATDEGLRGWVRDEGRGFRPEAVPSDRRGIADSVVGRLRRHGGEATVTSSPGEGTEVQLWLPRRGNP